MFDLEQAIAGWRRDMLTAGVKTPAPLEELEGHLREEVGSRMLAGMPEDEAFRLAVARFGHPQSLAVEFKKSQPVSALPAIIGGAVWTLGAIGLALFLFAGWMGGRLGLLLLAHVFTLTAGYGAAFLAGGFGIYYVCRRPFPGFLAVQQTLICRAVSRFSQLAAGLAVAGVLLGMVWYRLHHGHFLAGVPREIGALGSTAWLVAFSLIQRRDWLRPHAVMLFSIAGNMVISLGWFGAGLLEQGHSIGSYWPLNALLGSHLLFLLLGFFPAAEAAETGKANYV